MLVVVIEVAIGKRCNEYYAENEKQVYTLFKQPCLVAEVKDFCHRNQSQRTDEQSHPEPYFILRNVGFFLIRH